MKDAMKFASYMFGKGEGGGMDDASGFNMADMMKMMSAMNGMGGGGKKGSKMAMNKQGLRNLAKKAELQKKLAAKKGK